MGGNQQLFGKLAKRHLSNNNWTGLYPGWPCFADELETLLQLAADENQLDRFLPRLRARNRERNSALAELRAAYFFMRSGFHITQWEPPGNNGTLGEFSVTRNGETATFVEVKSPSWESELTPAEIADGRRNQPKYIPGIVEGGAVSLSGPIHMSIDKAYPKFLDSCPNLLIIADDLQMSLRLRNPNDSAAHAALYETGGYGRAPGYFTSNRYKNLGGVAIFNFDRLPAYYLRVYTNPHALDACKLSSSILDLTEGNTD